MRHLRHLARPLRGSGPLRSALRLITWTDVSPALSWPKTLFGLPKAKPLPSLGECIMTNLSRYGLACFDLRKSKRDKIVEPGTIEDARGKRRTHVLALR